MVGDGTYMMMNSDIYSTVLTGHKMIVDRLRQWRLCRDQPPAAVQGRAELQQPDQGLHASSEPFRVDFAKHAESMGALARKVESLADLEQAMDWAKSTDRTTVISIVSDAYHLDAGRCLWDVGVPQVSDRESVLEAAKDQLEVRKKQRVGV